VDAIHLNGLKDTIAKGNFQEIYDEFQKTREALAVGQNGEPTDPRLLIRDETNFWLALAVATKFLKTPSAELEDAMKAADAGTMKRKELFRLFTRHFQDRVDDLERQCDVWFNTKQLEKIRAATDASDCPCETCQRNRAGLAKLDEKLAAEKDRILNPDPKHMPPI